MTMALSEADLTLLADRVLGGASPSMLMVRAVESIVTAHVTAAEDRMREAVERAAWEVQRVINHWSSVPPDVLDEREAELADLVACRDRIAALVTEPTT